jgi:hypothetical protein
MKAERMKTKEEQADNYTQMQYVNYGDFSYRAEEQIREGFLAGYEANQPKWIDVNSELPDDDRTVLVWVNNLETPHWSTYGLGTYQGKWYLNGGRGTHEIVERWFDFPQIKKEVNLTGLSIPMYSEDGFEGEIEK